MQRLWNRRLRPLTMAVAIVVLAAACGDDADETDGAGGDTDGTTDQADDADDADTGDDGDGEDAGPSGSASLLHTITGEAEQEALQAMIDAYEESSGNTIEVEVSPDFETQIVSRVTGGNAPDVALYPQPGLLERMVEQGGAMPLADAGVDIDTLEGELVPGMVDTGTFEDETHGVVVKLAMKSLLWYPPEEFEAGGYEVPETWDDLLALTDTLSQDLEEPGRAPWCIGIEDGGSTGWVATDWIEDIMLRLHGPDVYDQWVTNELPFDSDEVREAFEHAETIWFDEDAVLGGTTGILQTPFGDSPTPMFDDPPGCMLHRQAGFITGFFPDGAELDADFAMAYLPPMDESVGSPVLFAGDLAAVHTDNEVAGDFVQFMASAEGQQAWMSHEGAGALSVRTDFDTGNYPSDALAQQGEFLAESDFARFDGSDLMPGEVGAGAFWSETVAWLSGSQDLDTTLQNIDAAWPS